MRTKTMPHVRAWVALAATVGLIVAVPPAADAAGAAPATPVLVAPANGGTVEPDGSLSVGVSDPDDASLDVTFHAAPRGEGEPGQAGAPFTFMVLPDTQNYVLNTTNTPLLTAQLQWIVAQRSNLNLAFLAGLGDIVDNRISDAQWTRASTAMSILDDGDIPHSVLPGNHDFDYTTGDFSKYDQYFPVSRYRDAGWNSPTASYGGYYGQNQFGADAANRQNMNSYSLFRAGGMDFLVLSIELNAPDTVLTWADRVIDAHPDRRVIVATHSFVNTTGAFSNENLRTDVTGNTGAQIWQKLIKPNCNVFFVINGHFTNGTNGEANRTDTNDCGKPVHSALTDYQGRPNGGDGWIRYYTFTPATNTIQATTYSPVLGTFETDANSSFTLNYDMAPPTSLPAIGQRTVASGGTASIPVPDVPEGTILDWYATVSDGTSVTRGPTWSTTVQSVPTVSTLAADAFSRTVSAGWGTADTGGAWTVNSTAKLTATGGVGRVSANAGSTLTASLGTLDSTAVDAFTSITLDRVPNQALTLTVSPRQLASSAYSARIRTSPNGSFTLQAMRGETILAGATVVGATLTAGAKINVRVQVEGTSPTTIRTRAWLDGTPEPAIWHATASDSTAGMQQAGGFRVTSYLSSSATNGPVIVGYDNLLITQIGSTPPPANTPPTAAFTWTANGLTVTADSSTSTDSDGSIATRTWNFDGAAASGVTATRTFPAAGTYPVTLTVTDDDGASASVTQNVTVTAPPPNTPPTAAFTWTANGLTVTADSSTSTDSDGTIATRTWNFDGAAASGVTATRTFPTAGTYPVTLTVTDDDGATASVTQNVTVTAPPAPSSLAADTFSRTVAAGWGTAETGGLWTVNSTAKLTVSGGAGRVSANTGSTLDATLGGVSSSALDATVGVRLDRIPNQYLNVSVTPRVVGSAFYSARVRVNPNGSTRLEIVRGSTVLAGANIAGLTLTAGAELNIRAQAQGASPTTLRARIWLDGTAEPGAWQVTASDATAGLQQAGSPRLTSYLSSSATNGPVIVTWDDLVVSAIP